MSSAIFFVMLAIKKLSPYLLYGHKRAGAGFFLSFLSPYFYVGEPACAGY